ncbi:hypothetical protein G5I_00887 [Acromyrmex echinatior]|uniref:Uncharacterized protein n=1 Tax=Acromyrmex echinatior TaxID=103372 RepID=F4W6Q4_ACREC|nr:hypothetical protein G5I_00887 [Acromyrmex echinatior]
MIVLFGAKMRLEEGGEAVTQQTPCFLRGVLTWESYPFRGETRRLQLQPAVAFPNVIGQQRGYLHFPAVPQSERLIKPQQRGKEPRVSPETGQDYLYDPLPQNQFRIIRFVVERTTPYCICGRRILGEANDCVLI